METISEEIWSVIPFEVNPTWLSFLWPSSHLLRTMVHFCLKWFKKKLPSLISFLNCLKTTGHETWLDQIKQHSFQLNPIHLENGLLRIKALFQSRIEHPMWDIFLFTGLLLISSSLLGLLPFMAVLWFISRSKDETFSHLMGSQKFTVYLVWMVVGAFMTHLFGGDIFPTYFKMIDDYLITISNSSWTNKTCLKYNQPLGTGDWNLKNFFYTKDYHGIFHHCFDCRDVGVARVC